MYTTYLTELLQALWVVGHTCCRSWGGMTPHQPQHGWQIVIQHITALQKQHFMSIASSATLCSSASALWGIGSARLALGDTTGAVPSLHGCRTFQAMLDASHNSNNMHLNQFNTPHLTQQQAEQQMKLLALAAGGSCPAAQGALCACDAVKSAYWGPAGSPCNHPPHHGPGTPGSGLFNVDCCPQAEMAQLEICVCNQHI